MALPQPSRITDALECIDQVFLNTPSFRDEGLSSLLGVDITFKDERQTPIGSFKGRGAEVLVSSLAAGTDIVCASAGNFGQGMAWAARRRGLPIIVFAAKTAVQCKLDRMVQLGADVRLEGDDFDDAKIAARAFAAARNAVFIEDGAHAEIAEGAGTLALELTRQHHRFDAVLVPLGNGALAAGVGCWMKNFERSTKVIAVAAVQSPAMGLAVLGRDYSNLPSNHTIADGIAVRVPVAEAVVAVRAVVDDVCFVAEESILRAVRLIEHSTGSKVEPAGAVGLAALLENPSMWAGERVAIPLCGGNRDGSVASAAAFAS